MKNSFLSKSLKKWKLIKKPFAVGILAITMLTAPLVGCEKNVHISKNDTSNTHSHSDSVDINDSSNSSSTDNVGDVNTGNKYFNSYSKVLQTVLKGSYYNQLMTYLDENCANPGNNIYYTTANNYAENVPYGFLNEQGYDIDAIKKADNSAVTSEVYIYDDEPNNLYVKCAVLNESSIDYYDTYLLKYSLTDTELRDLNRLFSMKECGFIQFKRSLYQAPFFIQELSYQKEPEVLLHSAMEAKTFNWFKNNLSTSDLTHNEEIGYNTYKTINGTGLVPIYHSSEFIEKDSKSEFMYHYISVSPNNQNFKSDDYLKGTGLIYDSIKCLTGDVISYGSTVKTIDNNKVLDLSSANATIIFYYKNKYPVDNSNAVARNATFYTVHNAQMFNGLLPNDNLQMTHFNDTSWLYKEIILNTDGSSNKALQNG